MTAVHEIDYGTLSWVKAEIDQTLDQARKALEAYVEDAQDSSQLRFCINHLHQVHGTLQMVEIYGAALAAEEMESLAVALSADEISQRDEAFEVLMRGILQLPDYLERLLQGQKDMPMVLLPLLNDLRAARGAPLLSENAVFSPDLDVPAPAVQNTGDLGEDIRARTRRLRHTYHMGLLGLFRDRDRPGSLTRLALVLRQLHQVATGRETAQLLWVAGGLIEALADEGVPPNSAVKLLLGQLDRELKRIIDHGEKELAHAPPHGLVKSLLYYVGRARSDGPQVTALKDAFRLVEQLPDDAELEEARAGLTAPNAALLQTVAGALHETLEQIKEQLDLFVRASERDRAQLQPLAEMMRQLADTLVMLGLGAQRQTVQAQRAVIEAMLSGEREVEDAPLMHMAGELLSVEASLAQLGTGSSAHGEDAPSPEYQQVVQSTIAEARHELVRVKEAIAAYSHSPEAHEVLAEVPAALESIRGSLTMLDMARAAELVGVCLAYVQQDLLSERIVPEPVVLDSLADAITSIEYYLESVSERWGSPKHILDTVAQSVMGLRGSDAAENGGEDGDAPSSEPFGEALAWALDAAAEGVAEHPAQRDDSDSDTTVPLSPAFDGDAAGAGPLDVAAPAGADDGSAETPATNAGLLDAEPLAWNAGETETQTPTESVSGASESDAVAPLIDDSDQVLDWQIEDIDADTPQTPAPTESLSDMIDSDFATPLIDDSDTALDWQIEDIDAGTPPAPTESVSGVSESDAVAPLIDDSDTALDWQIEDIDAGTPETPAPTESLSDTTDSDFATPLIDDSDTALDWQIEDIDAGTPETPAPTESLSDTTDSDFATPLIDDSDTALDWQIEDIDADTPETPAPTESLSDTTDSDSAEPRVDDSDNALDWQIEDIDADTPETPAPTESLSDTTDSDFATPLIDDSDTALDWQIEDIDAGTLETPAQAAPGTHESDSAEPRVDDSDNALDWPLDVEAEEITLEGSEPDAAGFAVDDWAMDDLTIQSASPERLTEALDLWLLDPSDTGSTELLLAVLSTMAAQAHETARTSAAAAAEQLRTQVAELAAGEFDATVHPELYAARDALAAAWTGSGHTRGLEPGLTAGPELPSSVAESTAGTSPTPASVVPESPAGETGADAVSAAPSEAPGPEIDDEIIEIFLEEAAEALADITRLLPQWRADLSDHGARADLRRAFHTLKGSGRLVGARDLGEFAWAFENMLNQVIDGTVEPGPDLFDLLERAQPALAHLFELFRTGGRVSGDILALMSQADALSRGEPIDPGTLPSPIDSSPPADLPPELASASLPSAPPEEFSPAAGSNQDAPELDVAGGVDPVLLEIYRKESEGHLRILREAVAAAREAHGSYPVNDALVRALHTLRGSSRTAGVAGVADLGMDLERYARLLQEKGLPLSADAVEVLHTAADLIAGAIDTLGERTEQPGVDPLRRRIAALVEQALHSVPPPVEVTSAAAAEPFYDEELLDIFLEEGEEILDSSEQSLQQWNGAAEDPGLVEQLQRDLHTLKGGARMAGIGAIGDLAHNLESLLIAVSDGHLPISRHLFDILQQAHDRLVHMLEQARQRVPVIPANDLLALLGGFLGRDTDLDSEDPDAQQEPASVTGAPFAPAAELPELPVDEPRASPASAARTEPWIEAGAEAAETTPTKVTSAEVPPTAVTPAAEQSRGEPHAAPGRVQHEQVRVRADLLDNLVNFAGEVSIYRSRLEQQVNVFRYDLHELDETIARLRDQLRNFEIETEAQIQYRYEESATSSAYEDFDPLEFDRFTTMQQLSRSMLESLNDLDSLRSLLGSAARESETLLLQQARINTDLQEGLMRARMVPFGSQGPRMRRIVRQAGAELGKQAELQLRGVDHEIDRQVLERIMAPLEHMLRNAMAHGIETPAARGIAGKPEAGTIAIDIGREGSEIVIRVSDDGGGINLQAIRDKAVNRGLIAADAQIDDATLLDMILESGFSTATEVTQIAGRGVGMDVVNSEIKQLGGTLQIASVRGQGSTFTVRLPLTLSVTRALVVTIGEEQFAVPLLSVQGVERLTHEEIETLLADPAPTYEWVGEEYRLLHLGSTMGTARPTLPGPGRKLPLLLTRSGEHRAALLVEGLQGTREVVVKSVGPQLSTLRGISGATITGDGEVQLILDLGVLVRLGLAQDTLAPVATTAVPLDAPSEARLTTVLVVDDSITVRKVTSRVLEHNGYRVLTAKDGIDALALLEDEIPDIMLLDIEMPRMDGFELASTVRNSERLREVPIIMITSRVADKHRQRALQIGVNGYMGKPFQEHDLLENIAAELKH